MAKSVVFHNRVIRHPGAEAFVDLAGLVQPGVDTTRIGAVVGEAPYGEPGVLHVFADGESARQYFGPSDLSDAINLLFEPSNDERVDGGAVLVYAYKTNRTTPAERWLVRDLKAGQKIVTLTAADFRDESTDPVDPASFRFAGAEADGTWDNMIVEIISGPGKGQQRQIASSVNDGGTQDCKLRADLDWDIKPFNALQTTKARIVAPMVKFTAADYGTPGNENEAEFGRQPLLRSYELQTKLAGQLLVQKDPFGGLRSPTFYIKMDPTGGEATWATNPALWAIPQAQDGGNPVEGTTVGGATATQINGPANALTPTDHDNRWMIVTEVPGGSTAAQLATLGKIYKIRTNDANNLFLHGPGLGVTPAVGTKWKVFQVQDVYLEIDGEDGEAKTLKIVISDSGGSFNLVDLILSQYPTLKDLEKKLDGIAGLSATIGDGVDTSLLTTRFDFGSESDHYGKKYVGTLDADANIGDVLLEMEETGHFPIAVPFDVYVEPGTTDEERLTIGNNDTVNDELDIQSPGAVGITHLTGSFVESVTGSQLLYGPADADDAGFVVRDNLQKLIDFVAVSVGAFTAERASGPGSSTYKGEIGSTQPEDNLDVFQKFYGGAVGSSLVNIPSATTPGYPISFQHGFDVMLLNRDIRVEVPLVSDDLANWTAGSLFNLINLFQTHLQDCDDNKAERIGVMGLSLPLEPGTFQGRTFTKGLLDVIRSLNDEKMSIAGQTTQVITSRGIEEVLAPWAYACQVAGTFLGVDRGEPITFKFIKTAALAQPYNDWDPRDPLDQIKILDGSLMYGEPFDGRWRHVRGFTSHIATTNLGRTDISVWDIRNKERRLIRDNLEIRFTGRGIGVTRSGVRRVAPADIGGIRSLVATLLEEERADGYIIDSQDENGIWQNAWRALSVRIDGDVGRVKVQVFPKTGLNYILIDIAFQIPRLSA